jgi:hypothetical protein
MPSAYPTVTFKVQKTLYVSKKAFQMSMRAFGEKGAAARVTLSW